MNLTELGQSSLFCCPVAYLLYIVPLELRLILILAILACNYVCVLPIVTAGASAHSRGLSLSLLIAKEATTTTTPASNLSV
jgi:hypothetical protein